LIKTRTRNYGAPREFLSLNAIYNNFIFLVTLLMPRIYTVCSSQTLLNMYHTTRCHISRIRDFVFSAAWTYRLIL